MTEPDFLELEEVLELHERQTEAFGGTLGIRDRDLLESALATPRATFGGQFVHEAPFSMAAANAVHLAEEQAAPRREQADRAQRGARVPPDQRLPGGRPRGDAS